MSAPATDPAAAVFAVRGLCKSYGGRAVLAGIDFEVARGESFAILGRSGSGKSVTLRLLDGLEAPDTGSIRFEGAEIAGVGEDRLGSLRSRVAMLFQTGALFDSMTVWENVAFPLRARRRAAAEIERVVADKLAWVGLGDAAERLPSELSGGMRKRAALARALALDPQVVLFDEPSTGLDPMTTASIARLLVDLRSRSGTTEIVVTHDLALARRVAERIAILHHGRFAFVGGWPEAERCADPFVRAFLAAREEESDAA